MNKFLIVLSIFFLFSCSIPDEDSVSNVSWSNDLQPIFEELCVSCHSTSNHQGGVDLSGYTGAIGSLAAESEAVKIIIPGEGSNSPLYQVVSTEDPTKQMPKGDRLLTFDEQKLIYVWINEGAVEN